MSGEPRKIVRRTLLKIGGATVGGLLASGQRSWHGQPFAHTASAASGSVTLTYLGAPFADQQAFVRVANDVGKSLGITVQPNWVPFDDVPTKAALDFRAGVTTWDMVFVYSNWVAQMAAEKMLVPLDPILAQPDVKRVVNPQDFIPIFSKALAYNGSLYGMPYEAAPWMLAYRADLFENPIESKAFLAKYTHPLRAPQTYTEWMNVAEFFTRKQGQSLAGQRLADDFYGIVAANKPGAFLWHRYEQIAAAFGADLIYDPRTMVPTWNSAQNKAAARYYVELSSKFMPPGNQNMASGEAVGLFARGRAAMTHNSLDGIVILAEDPAKSQVVGKVGYALMPTRTASRPHAFVQDANGIGIFARSTHRQEAVQLLARALSTKGNKQMLLTTRGLFPTRYSVGRDPEVHEKDPIAFQVLRLIEKEKPYVTYVPVFKEWPEAQDIAGTSISEALAGQVSVDQALDSAQAKLVDLFKRAGYIK